MTPAEYRERHRLNAYKKRLQRDREARREAARTSTHGQLKAEQAAYWEATGKGPGKQKTPPNQDSCARHSATA